MKKTVARQQEEELLRKRTQRYAEYVATSQSWATASPRLPTPPQSEQVLSRHREEEARRAWALQPGQAYDLGRGLGNSATRSILDTSNDGGGWQRADEAPGSALAASLLARTAANEIARDADGINRDADGINRDADDKIVVRDESAGIDVAYDPSGGAPDVDLKQVETAMGSGRPLDGGTREYMEWRFGLNLGNVRIHTGPKADALSKALMAHAFALGADVTFASGQYKPGTKEGDFLLAHELTHVVQAGHATEKPAPAPAAELGARKSASVSEPDDAIEVEADQVAGEVVSVGRSEFAKAKREGTAGGAAVESKHAPAPTARKAARMGAAPKSEGAAARRTGAKIARDSDKDKPKGELHWPRAGKEFTKTWRAGTRFEVKGKIKFGAGKASAAGKAKVPTGGPDIKADGGKAKFAFDATKGASSLALKLGELAMANEVSPGITITWAKLSVAEFKFGEDGKEPDFTALKVSASIKGDATSLIADPEMGVMPPDIAADFKKRYKVEVELEISAKPSAADLRRLRQFAKQQGKLLRAGKQAAAKALEKRRLAKRAREIERSLRAMKAERLALQRAKNAATAAQNIIRNNTGTIKRAGEVLERHQKAMEKAYARAAKAGSEWEREAAERMAKRSSDLAKAKGAKILKLQKEIADARKVLAAGKPAKYAGLIGKLAARAKSLHVEKLANTRAIRGLTKSINALKAVMTAAAKQSKSLLKAMKGPIAKVAATGLAKAVGKTLLKYVPVIGWILTIVDIVDIVSMISKGAKLGWPWEGGGSGGDQASGDGTDGGTKGGEAGAGGAQDGGTGGDPSGGTDGGVTGEPGDGSGAGKADGGTGADAGVGGDAGDGGGTAKPGGVAGTDGGATDGGATGNADKGTDTDQGGTSGGPGGEKLTTELLDKLWTAPEGARKLWAAMTETPEAQTPINNDFVKRFLDLTKGGVSSSQQKTILSHLGGGSGDPAKVLELIKGGISGELEPKEGKDAKPKEGFAPSDPAHGWGGMANAGAAQKVAVIIRGEQSHAYASPPTIEGIGKGQAIIYSVTSEGTRYAQLIKFKVVGKKLIIGAAVSPAYTQHARVLEKSKTNWGGAGEFVENAEKAGFVRDEKKPVVQPKSDGSGGGASDVADLATHGLTAAAGSLPFAERIQESFGAHDISGISAHRGPAATEAGRGMGAAAYASGRDVVFAKSPDLHTAAHEAAHVVQQAHGVSLPGGVGSVGDKYEVHADAVADAVVRGESAEPLLDSFAGVSSGTHGVQSKAVQRDGDEEEEREPDASELNAQTGIEKKKDAGESQASGNEAPTPAVGPNPDVSVEPPAAPGPGVDVLMSLNPSAVPTPITAPVEQILTQGASPSAVALDGAGPGHSDPSEAAENLLGTAWNFTANCFGPLVGYNSDRGGFAFDNLWGVGAGVDKIFDTAGKDRGEGALATTITVIDTLRAVSETVLSVASAIGMTCGILSLIGLFPPLAPVGAALAAVAGVCSVISFWAGIAATAFALITSVLSAVQLVQAVRDGAPNVAERYAQYQQDVGAFVADGIGILMVLGIKGITKGMSRANGYGDGMKGWSSALSASDGRVARGAAYQGLNSLGQAGAGTGLTLSTAGTTRAMLQSTLQGQLLRGGLESIGRSSASRVAITLVKTDVTTGAGSDAQAVRTADATSKAASSSAPITPGLASTVSSQLQSIPNQAPAPPVPVPVHSPSELLELANRRQEIAAARAHIDAQRIEGQTTVEGGRELQTAATQHEERATGLDTQVTSHRVGLADMHADAQAGIDEADKGAREVANLGGETSSLQDESEDKDKEVAGVAMPKPKKSTSWFDRVANWFQEKVFSKVADALAAIRNFVADIILKIVGFFMGVDDIDAQLAEVKGAMQAAKSTTEQTQAQTEQTAAQASTAHQEAAAASADAQTAISEGQAAVAGADSLDGQLMSLDQSLASEETAVQSTTDAWQAQHGATVDEAFEGGPVVEPQLLGTLESAAATTASGLDGLEDQASQVAQNATAALNADMQQSGLPLGPIAIAIESDYCGLTSRMDGRRGELAGLAAEIQGLDGARYAIVAEQIARIGGDIGRIAAAGEADAVAFGQIVQEALSEAAELMVCAADDLSESSNTEDLQKKVQLKEEPAPAPARVTGGATAEVQMMAAADPKVTLKAEQRDILKRFQRIAGKDPKKAPKRRVWGLIKEVLVNWDAHVTAEVKAAPKFVREAAALIQTVTQDPLRPWFDYAATTGKIREKDLKRASKLLKTPRFVGGAEEAGNGVQKKAEGGATGDVHAAAAAGISGSGGAMPHASSIQKSFGNHDIGSIRAHTGPDATSAAQSMGARAYATGSDVAFAGSADLHTAAHEAAHVVQQRSGSVSLSGGVGKVGDKYEKHADAVADAVVAGKSAAPILDQMAGGGASRGVQKAEADQVQLKAEGAFGGRASYDVVVQRAPREGATSAPGSDLGTDDADQAIRVLQAVLADARDVAKVSVDGAPAELAEVEQTLSKLIEVRNSEPLEAQAAAAALLEALGLPTTQAQAPGQPIQKMAAAVAAPPLIAAGPPGWVVLGVLGIASLVVLAMAVDTPRVRVEPRTRDRTRPTPHRGRLQVQGNGLEVSFPWAQQQPMTKLVALAGWRSSRRDLSRASWRSETARSSRLRSTSRRPCTPRRRPFGARSRTPISRSGARMHGSTSRF